MEVPNSTKKRRLKGPRTGWALGILFAGSLAISAVGQEQSNPRIRDNQVRVTTNEVIVPVTITDTSGELVLNLSQKDFRVYEDGIEQTINSWELGGEPLAVVLLIETSSRLSAMAPVVHSTGGIFTATVMALSGEAAVVTYDSTVEVTQPFTPDHDSIEKAISETKFAGGQVNLYDAMAASIELLKARPSTHRRVMLIIGESQDNGSKSKLRDVVREAGNANISIYVVGLSSAVADLRSNSTGTSPLKLPGLPPIAPHPCVDSQKRECFDLITPAIWLLQRGTNEIKHHQLELAAAATGGIDYRTLRDSEVRRALDRIGGELHAQYILSYSPSSNWVAGFHKITVSVSRPGVSIRARPGYYILAPKE
jgi:VWFA-related protein